MTPDGPAMRDDRPAWQADAECKDADPDLWFPTRGTKKEDIAIAIATCYRCPVRATCLEHALEHREDKGIWGGLGERARRRILRTRLAAETRARAGDPT